MFFSLCEKAARTGFTEVYSMNRRMSGRKYRVFFVQERIRRMTAVLAFFFLLLVLPCGTPACGAAVKEINTERFAAERTAAEDTAEEEPAGGDTGKNEGICVFVMTDPHYLSPELTDGGSANRIIGTFEEKDELKKILKDVGESLDENADEDGSGIQVFIGNESPVPNMDNCSMVTANYDLGNGLRGTVGIVGPKRMDYEKVLSTLRTLMDQLDQNFGSNSEKKRKSRVKALPAIRLEGPDITELLQGGRNQDGAQNTAKGSGQDSASGTSGNAASGTSQSAGSSRKAAPEKKGTKGRPRKKTVSDGK